ncbi:primosomal protein N' [Fructilactobacillus hinvesii]|uniref:Replication restart protein PriA n=1 Tax=Fructilactobacillus hinvesii TaxID=2940300 RepID=A0ABY5BR17_9LACO|nr:primosomal protein N' [Fructilactobacillus hinvesii]USS87550.1 primosomal protein N' [Fructilactobacillus hinvesii]
MTIAEIIVDVPTMQTNLPYSYVVPKELETKIQPGMRVVVPFGKGNRKVEGFVVKVDHDTEKAATATTQLKSLTSLMDLHPVVNTELLKLSQWLAETTYSFRISCLLTMLPNVMKAKYQTLVVPVAPVTDPWLLDHFPHQDAIPLDQDHFSNQELARLTELRKQGQVQIQYQVHNQAKPKTELAVLNQIQDFERCRESIRKNATGQLALLNQLERHPKTPLQQRTLVKQTGISPAVIKNFENRGWITKTTVEKYRNPEQHPIARDQPKRLTTDQQHAVSTINAAVTDQQPTTFLLEGVTGSGKTEVYLQTIQRALDQDEQALMLVPEIALTPQMVTRVKRRFGDQVAILHSGLSNGEKYDEWRRINEGTAQVVVGARSAIFAPLQNLGLIILDEEHDPSYKQSDNPRYHTRDIALWRAQYHHCPVILGSATPSLESRARAEKDVYHLLRLPERINGQQLPEIQVVDMTNALERTGDLFSNELLQALQATIDRHEQAVLLLNRRGFSSFMLCRDCGYVLKCPHCDISLTMHLDSHTMKCHYCGYETAIPTECPHCHGHHIRYFGTGTEKATQQLQQLLPQTRILRMDVDTTRKKGAHRRILQQFGAHQADILLGTQMIAKGLDFPDVTLVGVLNADTGLELPDFRASERTFDLLTQVAGRAGRAEKAGQVIIQTFNPEHYAIQLAQRQDYEAFFHREMQLRHLAGYSPYFYTVLVTVSALKEKEAAAEAGRVSSLLHDNVAQTTEILGPTPRPIARIKNRYYYQIIVKYKHDRQLPAALNRIQAISQKEVRKGFRIAIDVEPQSFM